MYFKGGQILRVAVTLSALKRIPVKIIKIRGGRSKPGLMEQHLKGTPFFKQLIIIVVLPINFQIWYLLKIRYK